MPIRLAFVLGAALAAASGPAMAQEVNRDRVGREAAAQAARADALFKAGRYDAALKLYRAEHESRKALGDARYEAYASRGVGCCLLELGDPEAAIDSFRAALAVDLGRDDKGFAGYDGLLLAKAELRLDRHADAVSTLDAALPRLDQAVDRDHECEARLLLVSARLALNSPAKALPDAARARDLARDLDDPRLLAGAWLALGRVDRDLGRLGPALMRLQDALDAYRDQDRPADRALATNDLADVAYRLGHRDRAAALFEEAAALHAKLGDPSAEADDRLDLASVRLDLGDPAASAREAALARDGFLAADDEASAIEAMVVLAQAQSRSVAKDALATAASTIRDALDRSTRAHRDAPAERVRLLLLSADLEHRLGRKAESSSRLSEAAKLADSASDPLLRSAVAASTARLAPKPR
jgi:tetratricopeptide (TPR) repeat protein